MASNILNEFRPDYIIQPGSTLLETLQSLGMSQAELAHRSGRPKKTISEIINGKVAITPETAIQFERVLGIPASFWINLECQYRENIARINENRELSRYTDWLNSVPVKSMAKLGWIKEHENAIEQIREILEFFGVTSPTRWKQYWESMPIAFRRSTAFEIDPIATTAWIRRGEILAQQIECKPYSADEFKLSLEQIRGLTTKPTQVFQVELRNICSRAGVAVIFVKELPKIRISGATHWLNSDKAIIQLSLRYRTDDHLWFTFFHEAGHILLHGKTDFFIEDGLIRGEKEEQANLFSANYLIPRNKFDEFVENGDRSKYAIRNFAMDLGIAPGIVVGQLQHFGYIQMSHCNDLKRHFQWLN